MREDLVPLSLIGLYLAANALWILLALFGRWERGPRGPRPRAEADAPTPTEAGNLQD